MPISVDLLTVAKKVNNYKADATAGGLWTSTTEYKATCPAGKRWFLLGGIVYRDVSHTLTAIVRDAADKSLYYLSLKTAATGYTGFPDVANNISNYVIEAGEYVQLFFGGAQSTGAAASCVVLEIDI